MVRTNGSVQRNAFSDSDGHFQFDGLPPGQITVTAQKPGFFSDQDVNGPPIELDHDRFEQQRHHVKLVPQSAIYGRVTDSVGSRLSTCPCG